PFVSVLRHDKAFAEAYALLDADRYRTIVAGMMRSLLDRDTAPGAEPEDLMALDISTLIVPGSDASHATSAARYLEECIVGAEYWDMPVSGQISNKTLERVMAFFASVSGS